MPDARPLLLTLLLAGTGVLADGATIYKCVQPDGRPEYSNVPCGPYEGTGYITGDTFSVYSRQAGEGIDPPISDGAIRRQQRISAEASERAADAGDQP